MGKDNTFFCTCALSSDIKYCACTLKIRVNKKEVIACNTIAIITIPKSEYNLSKSLFGTTSSSNILLYQGKIKPERLFITIKINPIKTKFLLGQIIVLNAFPIETLGFFFFSDDLL